MTTTTKEIFSQNIHQPVLFSKDFEFDESLPDYLPNIKEALYLDGYITEEKTSHEDEKIKIEYTVKYKLYYVSEQDDSLRVFPFTQSTSIKTDVKHTDGSFYLLNSFISPSQARLLNSRKIFVRSAINCEMSSVEGETNSVLSEVQENCFTKTSAITSSSISKIIGDKFIIEDELILGDGYEPIGQIIDVSAKLSTYECEAIPSYCILKGTVDLSILYSSEVDEKRIIHLERQISLEKSIPYEHIDDECHCFCNIEAFEKESIPSIDAYGEYRVIKQKLEIVADIFSIKDRYDSVVTDIFAVGEAEKSVVTNLKQTQVKKELEKDISIDGIVSTEDLSFSRILSTYTRITLEPCQNDQYLSGKFHINIIGETANGLRHFYTSKEFGHKFEYTPVFPKINDTEFIVSIAGENSLSYRADFKVSALSFTNEEIETISSVEFTELEKPKEHMVIYFPNQDEQLWEIAKKYHVSPDIIKSNNPNFKGEKAAAKEIVLIKFN